MLATTSASGVARLLVPMSPISMPASPAASCTVASAPDRVASKRSNAVGAPPRCTCPMNRRPRFEPEAISVLLEVAHERIGVVACALGYHHERVTLAPVASGAQFAAERKCTGT